MSPLAKKRAKSYFESMKKDLGITETGNNDNSEEDKTPTKEEFAAQSEFEQRMRVFVKELRKAKEEEDLAKAEEENLNVNVGGAGSVSLRPEDIQRERGQSGNLEFDSHEAMIDYLRAEAMKGNAEAKENLEKLWKKVLLGMKEQPTKMNFQYQDKNWLTKLKKTQTLEWKKKQGVKENE